MTIRRLAAWAALALALALDGCGGGSGRFTGTDVTVTAAGPTAPLFGGDAAAFTMTVANTGDFDADNLEITDIVGNGLALTTITCSASGGAVCPATLGVTMTVPSLHQGGSLVFTVNVTVQPGASGQLNNALSVTLDNDNDGSNNRATATAAVSGDNLSVSQSIPSTTVGAGGDAVFTALVGNPGGPSATNVAINWSFTAPAGVTFDAPTCTASGGAECPAVLGAAMTVASLGPGRTLSFRFTAHTTASVRGDIVNTVAVSADQDLDTSNNNAVTTATVGDPRNGAYTAFGADGRPYTFTIDFDAATYTMTAGDGSSVQRMFTLDAGGSGDYVVSGNARLRVAQDLIVGGHDFGGGVLPFVAARNLVTVLAGTAGTYDLATRNVPAAGAPPVTHAGTASITGNVLTVCQSDVIGVVDVVRNCDPAARKDYNLTVSGNVVTGTTSGGETYAFSVANSGAAKVLLSAGPAPDGSQQLRVGLADAASGLTFGTVRGPSSTGDWIAIALTNPPAYAASGSTTSDSASLATINGGAGPFSMLVGTSATYGAPIYVMQTAPLVVVVGGVGTPASGLLQVGLP